MAGLFCEFLDAAGEPCQGTVTLTPKGAFGSRVVLVLDEGEIDSDITPGDYRVDIRLKNADTVSREISVPDGDAVDLRTLTQGYAPAPSEASTAIFAAGPFVFDIPWWATHIDRVLLGGGGGGDDGATLTAGKGGGPGSWIADTLVRGTDIPWDSTQITGTIGDGGTHNEGNGGATTASAIGADVLTAPGGTGGTSSTSTGSTAGTVTFNNIVYNGGADQATKGANGFSPGGGGAGGNSGGQDAGAGASGGAWFRVYRQGA